MALDLNFFMSEILQLSLLSFSPLKSKDYFKKRLLLANSELVASNTGSDVANGTANTNLVLTSISCFYFSC